jgi:bacterial/archaeal transporter family-2 protein
VNAYIILPFLIGLAGVAQGILNRQVSASWGLTWAVVLNAVLFIVYSLVLLGFLQYAPQVLPEYLRVSTFSTEKFKWWFVLPGLCGFLLVLGIPWSIQIMGPSKTFILFIVAQIVFSLLAEKFFFGSDIPVLKIAGALLAMCGAALVMWSPN